MLILSVLFKILPIYRLTIVSYINDNPTSYSLLALFYHPFTEEQSLLFLSSLVQSKINRI